MKHHLTSSEHPRRVRPTHEVATGSGRRRGIRPTPLNLPETRRNLPDLLPIAEMAGDARYSASRGGSRLRVAIRPPHVDAVCVFDLRLIAGRPKPSGRQTYRRA